ncbi:hypothetical protein M501DRAFT_1013202 [Patellaria atrata CBS 101060]|uniref:Uncharacterized protein n=1 Tax=Patellaria atrata CBS 101060 TaxID=1346257 RepID=A0A9P4VVM1_9PEZI|nr:hypothetical protein M501DRAFT_1013202 [Patellaria atrata CBS 101060]
MSASYEVSNVKPITIFSSYMLLAITLTSFIIRRLIQSSPTSIRPKNDTFKIILFSILAIISLGTTWFYMLEFFKYSYRLWAERRDIKLPESFQAGLLSIGSNDKHSLRLGSWLKDSKLFKEAWGTALETPLRQWWTQQIFFFAALLSLLMSYEVHISHAWAFVLLGQLVAISFASNLFFLAVLVKSESSKSRSKIKTKDFLEEKPVDPSWIVSFIFQGIPLIFTLVCVVLIPYVQETQYFLPVLLVPHAVLFIPPLLPQLVKGSSSVFQRDNTNRKALLETIFVLSFTFLQITATTKSVDNWRFEPIWQTLYEHPAVSSVGWDVIMCTISYTLWTLVGKS